MLQCCTSSTPNTSSTPTTSLPKTATRPSLGSSTLPAWWITRREVSCQSIVPYISCFSSVMNFSATLSCMIRAWSSVRKNLTKHASRDLIDPVLSTHSFKTLFLIHRCHICFSSFDPSLGFSTFCPPFRVPGEKPRQPSHGYHSVGPLIQEQVHQADLPGWCGHGEDNVAHQHTNGLCLTNISSSCFPSNVTWGFFFCCPLAFIFLLVLAVTNGTLPVCCSVSSDFSSDISFCVAINSPAPPLPR